MTCSTCPFSGTDAAESAMNLGCLPFPYEIMQLCGRTGKAWPCHSDPTRMCAGYIAACAEAGIDWRTRPLGSYQGWYESGEAGFADYIGFWHDMELHARAHLFNAGSSIDQPHQWRRFKPDHLRGCDARWSDRAFNWYDGTPGSIGRYRRG
jgi:hypothetical protein